MLSNGLLPALGLAVMYVTDSSVCNPIISPELN